MWRKIGLLCCVSIGLAPAGVVFAQPAAKSASLAAREKPEALRARAEALAAEKKCEEAVEAYRAYLEVRPDDIVALRNLAVCERYVGNFKGALEHLRAVRDLLEKRKRRSGEETSLLQDVRSRIEMSEQREKGIDEATNGLCDDALPKLRRVNADGDERTAASLFWAAQCEEDKGRLFEAYQGYRELAEGGSGHSLESRAKTRMAAVSAVLPKIRIAALFEAPTDTAVDVDWHDDGQGTPDETLARSDLPKTVVLPLGRNKLTIRAKGREPREQQLVLARAETLDLAVTPGLRGPAEWAYQGAKDKIEKGAYADALDLAKAAEYLFPNIEARYLIARATFGVGSEKMGMQLAADVLDELPAEDPRRPGMMREIERMQATAPQILVTFRREVPPSSVITLDGLRLKEGMATKVDSGTYLLAVQEKLGGLHGQGVVNCQQGEVMQYSVGLLPRKPHRHFGGEYASFGVATATLGSASVLGLLAAMDADRLRRMCPVPANCTSVGEDLASRGSTESFLSTFLAVISVLPAGIGAIFLFGEPRIDGPSLQLTPIAAPDRTDHARLGFSISGVF